MKKISNEGNQIHNWIPYLWELLWFHFITVPVPLSSVIKLRFRFRYGKKLLFLRLRFRFRNPGIENWLVNESEVPNNNLDSAGDGVESISVHLPHVAWVQPPVSIKHLQPRILWCNRLHIDGGQERWIHRFTLERWFFLFCSVQQVTTGSFHMPTRLSLSLRKSML